MERVHAPEGVDLWIVKLDDSDEVPRSALRRQDDLARHAQIVPPARKRQFAFRRAVRDYVLRQYVDQYAIRRDASGKPQLLAAGGPLHFSASSSAGVCAIGVSRQAVGIDLECCGGKVDLAAVCERYVPGFARLGSAWKQGGLHDHLAMCAWCRTESYVKLHGLTLHDALAGRGGQQILTGRATRPATSDMVVAGDDYLCVISQARHFGLNQLHHFGFERVRHASKR
ncbi:hypothetical protein HSX11_17165 [Oxalobacteraceae bacterium]|nr:hypothetical protein [Oxalobacteraceae bacterium]